MPGSINLSGLVRRLSEGTRQAFHAQNALLILLPEGKNLGYFYDFTDSNLYHFEYQNSFLEDFLCGDRTPMRRTDNPQSVAGR